MAYMKIPNLYRDTRILDFKQVFALEKIHGTSAHVTYKDAGRGLSFYSGGAKQDTFVALFYHATLLAAFQEIGHAEVVVYGEAYGGKCQGMSRVYGPDLKFVAFEVRVGDSWLAVPDAALVVAALGLEFVYYSLSSTDLGVLDMHRDAPSEQARRNGMGEHPREGIVIRPPFEVTLNNGKRLIAKHKTEAYQERRKQPKVGEKSEGLKQAEAIAREWATPMRLTHVVDGMTVDGEAPGVEQTGDVIRAMLADVEAEAAGEIEMSKAARKVIGRCTAQMFKARLQEVLHSHV